MKDSPVSRRGILVGAGVGTVAAAATVLPGGSSAHANPPIGKGPTVLTGADVAHANNWRVSTGRRIGIITNPSGVIREGLISIVDAMHASGTVDIGAVF